MSLSKWRVLCLLFGLLFGAVADAKILFSSIRDGIYGIYIMDDDGSNQTLLIAGDERPHPECWSPDGKQFVGADHRHVFLMRPDGTYIRELIIPGDDVEYVGRMSFSPDGKSLVFDMIVQINNKPRKSINVLNIETGVMKEISDSHGVLCDWSPDGKSIVFADGGVVGEVGGTLWKMGDGGQKLRKLLPPPLKGRYKFPRWSPDGRQIVFTHQEFDWQPWPGHALALIDRAHRYMICDLNGNNVKQLQIPKDWRCYGIDWMDDGESVVFSARQGMPLDEPILQGFEYPPCYLYKYHIQTGEITQLTNDPGWDQSINWISDDVLPVSPQGKKK